MKIKSIFEQISSQVFSMTDLTQAKAFVTEFVSQKGIKEEDKSLILNSIKDITSMTRFQSYICNSLLKYEGMGMNQLERKEK
jgi:hypothetical protein